MTIESIDQRCRICQCPLGHTVTFGVGESYTLHNLADVCVKTACVTAAKAADRLLQPHVVGRYDVLMGIAVIRPELVCRIKSD